MPSWLRPLGDTAGPPLQLRKKVVTVGRAEDNDDLSCSCAATCLPSLFLVSMRVAPVGVPELRSVTSQG